MPRKLTASVGGRSGRVTIKKQWLVEDGLVTDGCVEKGWPVQIKREGPGNYRIIILDEDLVPLDPSLREPWHEDRDVDIDDWNRFLCRRNGGSIGTVTIDKDLLRQDGLVSDDTVDGCNVQLRHEGRGVYRVIVVDKYLDPLDPQLAEHPEAAVGRAD